MTRTAGMAGTTIRTRLLSCAFVLAVVCGVLAFAGASSALADQATYTANQSIPVPPASNFSGSAGGDGWAVALSSNEVFNVFHHQDTLQVACHKQADASNCWPTTSETITDGSGHNFGSSGHPGMYLDQSTGKLYVFATRTSDDTGGVVCIDTTQGATNSDPFCGFTPLTGAGEATNFGLSNLSMPMQVGSKLYSFNYFQGAGAGAGATRSENAVLCFDLTTFSACSGQPFTIPLGGSSVQSGGFPEPATAVIAGTLIIPISTNTGYKVACFDPSTGGECAGSWPVSDSSSDAGNYGAPYPKLDATGAVTGLCLPTGSDPCFKLDGSGATTPSSMTSVIGGSSAWNGPGTIIGSRVYVPNGNANNYSGAVECYDYATSAGCANFPKTFNNLSYLYTVNLDPQRPTCLWVNADGGSSQIQNVDAFSGQQCGQGPLRILASQFVVGHPACAPTSYVSLQLTSPARNTYTSGTITFEDGDGNPISGVSPVALDSTGTASLQGLNLNTSNGLPQFLITLNGYSGSLSQVDVQLLWTGANDPSCVGPNATAVAGPENTSPPTISGTPQDGKTLTADPGLWSMTSTYAYQWYDCTSAISGSAGSGCTPIGGATGSTYVVKPGDVGDSIEVAVAATGGGDTSSPVPSVVTGPVIPGAAALVSVSMSPSYLYADGTSASTATAYVTDAWGVPVPGDTVAFSSNGAQTVGSTTDDGNGTYTAHVTSSTSPGTASIKALDSTSVLQPSGGTTLTQVSQPGPAAIVKLTLAPSTLTADGYSTSLATATVTDANGNPVLGDPVTIVSNGAQQIGAVTPGPTPGTYQAWIMSSTTAGPSSITATDNAVNTNASDTQTLTQVPGRAAYVTVSLNHPSITADGVSTTTAMATVTDLNGNPVSGDHVSFATTGGQTIGSISPGANPGTYVVQITSSTTAGASTISARDTSAIQQPSGSTTLAQVPGPASSVSLALSPASVVANGTSTSTATATVTDAHGNPVSGDTVTIGSTGGQTVSPVAPGPVAGTYLATITSTATAGTTPVSATDTSAPSQPSDTKTLTQVVDKAAYVNVSLSHPSITADGTSTSIATATVTDQHGNPISGDNVAITSDGGQTVGSVSPGANPGTYQATITSTTSAGTATVTGQDLTPAAQPAGTATLSQVPGPASSVSLALSPASVVANGTSTSVATATVTDAHGNPVSGDNVTIGSSGPQPVGPVSPGVSPGTYVATITSTRQQGTATITGTDTSGPSTPAQSKTLTQTPDRAAYVSVLLSHPSITADGASTTTATALVTDQNGNPVSGDAVSFASDGGQTVGSVTDNHDGTYTALITSTRTAGVSTITVTDTTPAAQPAGTAQLTQTAGPATAITLSLSKSSITADGTSSTVATADVTDANGNPVSGDAVTIASDGAQQVASILPGPTPGTYLARITATGSAGTAHITATDTSVTPNLTSTRQLTQVAGSGDDVDLTLSPASITADGTSTTQATATVTDASGNPVSGDQVKFTSSGAQKIGSVSPEAQPGTYQATITSSTAAGTATITASDTSVANASDRAALTQTAGAPSHVTVSLSPNSVPADGKSTVQATVTITDANGNPISGDPVKLTSSGGDQIGPVTPSGAPGGYTATITAGTQPSTVTISAQDGGATGSATLTETDPLLTSDLRIPTIQINTPAAGGIYLLHQSLGANYVCTDPLGVTDVLSCAGPNREGARIDTNELGTHAFAVTAVNRAGQTMRVMVHYVVVAARPMPTTPLVYLSGPLSLRHGKVSIPVGCLSPTGGCSGGLTLRMTLVGRTASGQVSYRYVKVGFRTYRLRSGRRHVIQVKLSAMGSRAFTPTNPLPTIILGVKQLGGAPQRVVIN